MLPKKYSKINVTQKSDRKSRLIKKKKWTYKKKYLKKYFKRILCHNATWHNPIAIKKI